MKSGIYKISIIGNTKCYIGSSIDIKRRLTDHKAKLKNNKHANKSLQSSFNKYGIENLTFEILEYCIKDNLIEREQFFIDSFDKKFLYNHRLIAESNLGYIASKETRLKISKSLTGRKLTNEWKANIALAKIGNKSRTGLFHTQETKELMSFQATGRKQSTEHIGNFRASRKGYKPTEETKEKTRQSMLLNVKRGADSPNYGKKHKEETKLKMSFAAREFHSA